MNPLEIALEEGSPSTGRERNTCTVCRAYFPPGGQQTGPWFGAWGPSYQVCKWCVDAGRTARRARERDCKLHGGPY